MDFPIFDLFGDTLPEPTKAPKVEILPDLKKTFQLLEELKLALEKDDAEASFRAAMIFSRCHDLE